MMLKEKLDTECPEDLKNLPTTKQLSSKFSFSNLNPKLKLQQIVKTKVISKTKS